MKLIRTLYLLMATLLLTASCNDTDSNSVILYNDAAITSFSLGTVNRYVNGKKTTLKGTDYKFYIDHQNHSIYNPDSLPVGCDAAHLLCTVTALNNGQILYWTGDTDDVLTHYSATDSIDFSKKRMFRVYASSGSGYTDYEVKVNVHQQDGEVFVWKTAAYTAPTIVWKSSKEQYRLSATNKLEVSQDGGVTWTQDLADDAEDAAKLPTQHVSLVSYPMWLSEKTDYVLLAGTSTAVSGKAAIWKKEVDYYDKDKKPSGKWVYLDQDDTNFQLPALTNLSLIWYDKIIFAFGGDFKKIYESRDNGITWKVTKRLTMPADFDYTSTSVKVTTDADNYVWIYCTDKNKAWKGRLNRLGWKNQ